MAPDTILGPGDGAVNETVPVLHELRSSVERLQAALGADRSYKKNKMAERN